MSTVLITGITGFAGNNLVQYFRKYGGVTVVGHSRDPESARAKLGSQGVSVIDKITPEVINDFRADTIIHLAGIAHDLGGAYKESDYERVNFENTRKTYHAFLSSAATRFIFLSSIKAAVDHSEFPVDESVTPSPVTPYGKSKLKAEQFIQSMALPVDKKVYIFRPCMIHGPGNKGNLNLLFRFVKSGFPWPLGAFENKRSFLSAENFTFIVHHFMQKDIPSGVYHLADDGSLSTNELVTVMASAMGRRTHIWKLPSPVVRLIFAVTGQSKRLSKLTENLVVSNAKLNQALQKPLPVPIGDGIKKTVRAFS